MKLLEVEFKRKDERGKLTQVNSNIWKQLNHLEIKQGNSFGGHYHKNREEFFYVINGEVQVLVQNDGGKRDVFLKKGECLLIEPYDKHTIYAITDLNMVELLSEPYNTKDNYE